MTTPTTVLPQPDEIAQAFLRPRNHGQPSTLGDVPGARRFGIESRAGRIAAAAAGEGPAVLFVHGWEGRAGDLAAFAPPLLAAGLRVVAVDLPAHGDSAGTSTSIPASARALLDVGRALGPLHGVLAHSVGSAVAVEAMAQGLDVQRAALVAAPARYADYARAFAAQAGLDAAGTAAMIDALHRRGVDVHAVAMPLRAPHLWQRALFVHSDDDRVVPIADALETAALWPGARLVRFAALGHRRILGDAAVVSAVVEFLAAA